MIASVVYEMAQGIVKEREAGSIVIMAGAFLITCILEVNVVYVIITCALIGIVRARISGRRARK